MGRQDRRRLDAQTLQAGYDPALAGLEPVVSLARVISKLVEQARATRKVFPLVSGISALIAKSQAGLKHADIACGKGCSHCCNTWVDCTAPELLFLNRALPPPPAPVDDRLAAFMARWGNVGSDARETLMTPCPLLEQALCGAYDARPLNCRLAVSADSESCRKAFIDLTGNQVPVPVPFIRIRDAYSRALSAALRHAGLSHHVYELVSGLSTVRSTEHAEARWLAGEDIFAHTLRSADGPQEDAVVTAIIDAAF